METVISNTKVSVKEFREMLFDDDDNYYYEIINGEMIQKSAPTPMHQQICKILLIVLDKFVTEKKSGEVFQSPVDVFLDDYNKPQPDLIFVSNEKKSIVTNDGIMGIPDLIVEIISPTSVIRDRIEKKNLYEQVGVREYWLVDPQYAAIEIYSLKNGRYELYSAATILEGELKTALLEGLIINLADIFSTTVH
jgi:Uma2 family endonuclease